MPYAIDLENVSFGYQADCLILEDVNWKVEEGQFVAVVGPNGGGKTTLLKLILGNCPPWKGSIQIYDKPASDARALIAYVPQNLVFDRQFPISVFEVVLMGLLSRLPWYGRYSKQDKDQALQALEQVGLRDLANASFGQISGGQRQRTLIARALVSQPRILLLDEPTASVDAQAEAEIYRILSQLQGKITIIMVTHDLQTAMKNVSNVVCVQRTLRALSLEEVCQHYAIGLYHPPVSTGKLNVVP